MVLTGKHMTKKDLKQISEMIDKAADNAIEKYVNGGIRSLTTKVDDHIKRAEPMLKVFEEGNITKMKFRGGFKTIVFYAGGTATISGALAIVWWIIKIINPFK